MNFYHEYSLSQKSRRFIRKIWVVDNSAGCDPLTNLGIVPNGCFNIAFVKGVGANVIIQNREFKTQEAAYFCSQTTQKVSVSFREKSRVIFIQIEPWALCYFYNYDLSSFTDTISLIDDNFSIFGTEIYRLSNCSIEELIEKINNFSEYIEPLIEVENEIELICKKIFSTNGQIDIAELFRISNVSKRSLQIRFKKATGLTISKFINIIKLRSAIDRIQDSKDYVKLIDIATDSNYFDQAHFIKNFKDVTKVSPKKFVSSMFLLSKKV